MTFEVIVVGRKYGKDGFEESRKVLETFQGLKGFDAAASAAANLALVGKVVEVWANIDTLQGVATFPVAYLSWWAWRRGAASVAYDIDYLDPLDS